MNNVREKGDLTNLFSSRRYLGDFKEYELETTLGNQREFYMDDLSVQEILSDQPDLLSKYLKNKYATQLEKGRFPDASEEEKLEATRWLDDTDLKGENPGFRRNQLSDITQYLLQYRRYQDPAELTPLTRNVDEVDEDYVGPITTPSTMVGLGAALPPSKKEAETDYGIATEDIFIDEEERQGINKYQVNPNRYFQAGEGFLNKWLNNLEDTPIVGGGLLPATVGKQLNIDKESPWRLKAFFLPSNPTPQEMEFILENEFPNIKNRVRYLNRRDPSAGLVIRVPKIGGKEGEEEYIPIRPQFGMDMISEEVLTMLGQESGTILVEGALLKGQGSLARTLKKGSGELAEILAQGAKKGKVRGFGRAMRDAGTTSIAAALGRYGQLLYGRERGINNLSEERMFEDAQLTALLAGTSSVVMSAGIGIVSKIHRLVTGEDIPVQALEKIYARLEDLKKVEGSEAVEFTNETLIAMAEDAGAAIGKGTKFRPTIGQLTEDSELQILEQELFSQLIGLDSKAAKAFKEIVLNNREAGYAFWQAINKNNPELADIKLQDFQTYIRGKNQEFLEDMKLASEMEKEKIQDGLELGIERQSPLKQTTEELGAAFTRDATSGGYVLQRDSKEFALNADNTYHATKTAYENELEKLSGIAYDKGELNNRSISLIIPEMRKILNAGEDADIIKTLADAELGKVIKDIIPMREGVSVLRQLAGEIRDKEGKVIKPLKLTYGDYMSMAGAVESVLYNHPDNAVKAAAKPLYEAIVAQADDLLEYTARKELKEAGVGSPSEARIKKYLKEAEWLQPLYLARDNFNEYKKNFDRKYFQNFASQQPENLASFILKSSPQEIEKLLQQIYTQPDSIVKLQNIRQLVLDDINSQLDPKLPLAEQNKIWQKYAKDNETQLKALFPEEDFLKIANFNEAQQAASRRLQEIDEGVEDLEKELELEGGLSNFIQDILMVGKTDKLTQKHLVAIEKFQPIRDKYPELDGLIFNLTKNHLRSAFQNYRTAAASARGEAGEAYQGGGIDFNGLRNFIDAGFKGGKEGQEGLRQLFQGLFGHETGAKYAADLRAFVFLSDKLKKAPMDEILETASGSTKDTLDTHIGIISALQRILISPLTKTSRQITFAKERLRINAAEDLLEIMIDPSKMRKLMAARNKRMTVKQLANFLASLAVTRSQIDMGTSRGETTLDVYIKQAEEAEAGEEGEDAEIDTMSRIWDLLTTPEDDLSIVN